VFKTLPICDEKNKIHQENENTRKDIGNTSIKSIVNKKCLSNMKKPQLKVYPLGGRSNKTTLNHHPVEAIINKAIKGTTLKHQEFSIIKDKSIIMTHNHPCIEAQQRLAIHDGSLSNWLNHHEQKHNTRVRANIG